GSVDELHLTMDAPPDRIPRDHFLERHPGREMEHRICRSAEEVEPGRGPRVHEERGALGERLTGTNGSAHHRPRLLGLEERNLLFGRLEVLARLLVQWFDDHTAAPSCTWRSDGIRQRNRASTSESLADARSTSCDCSSARTRWSAIAE